jgi:hypothetical protein
LLSRLSQVFATRQRLRRQQREIDALRAEVADLRAKNESMRAGMRRCLSCEYRIGYKERHEQTLTIPESSKP